MITEARLCGLQDKQSYDCHGRMGRYCEDCNMIIETVADLPECRLCDEKHCVQVCEVVAEFGDNNKLREIYDGKLDNCSYRRYRLSKI